MIVRAASQADPGEQTPHGDAVPGADRPDEDRLLPIGQVVRVCAPLFSHQFQRPLEDRQLDLRLPFLPADPLQLGAHTVALGNQPVQIRRVGIRRAIIPLPRLVWCHWIVLRYRLVQQLTLPVSHDRRLHAHLGRDLPRRDAARGQARHRHTPDPVRHRPASDHALPGRQLVDPRRQHLMAGIPHPAHRPAQPPAMRQVMIHRSALLLVRVPRITLATPRGNPRTPLLQPLAIPHEQRLLAGIAQLPDHVRRTMLVPLVQLHRTPALLPRIPRHDDDSSRSRSPTKRHHPETETPT
ncbi:hypothetical protein B5782_0945 [Bifidobacterium catenulatum]|uniref:Hypoyhetical protein n=1 Tax=Bifidobacterium catenulatum TaxID=1686 RepID=A0A1V8PQI5_9BIFI|nr:hypothetical protein B5782_0945 [Bifidobacterium catenulatum]